MDYDRQCMSDRIRQVLTSRIFDGTLKAGDRLVELEIAREFDTSQTPVREALRELESLRLVDSVPYRGTRVREIREREMVEAYTVRGALEQLAGELAAPRLLGNVIQIRESLTRIHEAAREGDIEAYARHNMDFHRAIVVASDNNVLIQSWDNLAFEARVRLHLRCRPEPHLADRAREHDPVVDALEAGDGLLAGQFLRAHAESCKKRWCETVVDAVAPAESEALDVQTLRASCLS
ncbi:GntR family transcriptional regulator [Schlesneria paludicola]|uniref:GntR family transcriptional regulator n=1 Tax=Schlesneria paludicola TaxID=360056 RepID=UPI00029A2982|nr:GntR family transcriptional regulator [Schlesneria paludicola]